jgi:tellurite resistance protein TehA-like permease
MPLSPGWASYTFPVDIVSIALMRYLALYPDNATLRVIAWIAFVVANAVVATVLVGFLVMARNGELLDPYEKDDPVVSRGGLFQFSRGSPQRRGK